MLSETAYAKINLALHVRRRRDDGYHDLETVFAFCEHGDIVSGEVADTTSLTIDGPFARGLSAVDNLVNAAALSFGRPARLHLTKNLPVASGIGGGSADAGATLRLLHRLHGTPLPPLCAQRALGADVPACVLSETRRGEGIGERLMATLPVTGLPVLLVNPGVPLSTAQVFGAWDGVDHGELVDWGEGRNDLEAPARKLVPAIGALLDWMRAQDDVMIARMSGSGATCFALFADALARSRVRAYVATEFPSYWLLESTLR